MAGVCRLLRYAGIEWPDMPTLSDSHGRRQPDRPCQDKGRGFKTRLAGIAARAQVTQGAV
jgi:hypothetical protein